MKKKQTRQTACEILPAIGPKIGAFRIRYNEVYWCRWSIQRYGCYCFFGYTFPKPSWCEVDSAMTLWGIKRQWKKLFGASKPFPSFTVWQSEEVV